MTHILVTGASGGIGAAICRALARRGVTVLLHYRSNRTAAEATRQALGKSGCPKEWGAGAVVTSTEEAAAFATAGFTWFTFDLTAPTDDRSASMSLDQLDAEKPFQLVDLH